MDAMQCYATIKTVFMRTLNDRGKYISLNVKEQIQVESSVDINSRKLRIRKERKTQIFDVYRSGC